SGLPGQAGQYSSDQFSRRSFSPDYLVKPASTRVTNFLGDLSVRITWGQAGQYSTVLDNAIQSGDTG
ncbi:hypothetical protein RRG08_011266, partial [Elysia crispata]